MDIPVDVVILAKPNKILILYVIVDFFFSIVVFFIA